VLSMATWITSSLAGSNFSSFLNTCSIPQVHQYSGLPLIGCTPPSPPPPPAGYMLLTKKFWDFFYVLNSTLLYLPPLRFHCVGGCCDRTKGLLRLRHWQSDALTPRPDLIHNYARSHPLRKQLLRNKNVYSSIGTRYRMRIQQ
jgi:hypothetical protein